MFSYYLGLGLRSLKRNLVLTLLMVAAIGVGIGAAMTVYTLLRATSVNPIPDKSSKLYVPLIDNWGPNDKQGNIDDGDRDQVSWPDAHAWLTAHRAVHQAAMYSVYFFVTPPSSDAKSFYAPGRATTADFFAMFEVPFRAGTAWGQAEDDAAANVVVISSKLADRLFVHGDAVGQSISLNAQQYRIIGVLGAWEPTPRFYDLTTTNFGDIEDVFFPLSTAFAKQMDRNGSNNCVSDTAPGWDGHLNSECLWLQYWVELPTTAALRDFKQYLANYAAEQKRSGRFTWDAATRIYDVPQWLAYEKVVPSEIKVSTLIAFGFLLVCLVNSVGLMLAKMSSRANELGVRRALGASKGAIFLQCLTESAIVGAVGGLLGLLLTKLGLILERGILPEDFVRLTELNPSIVVITLSASVVATIGSGLYPSWRASHVQPGWQLKAQ
jgi:putative ABC transport system permease protein